MRWLIAFLLLSAFHFSNAQGYHPFPVSNARWSEEVYNFGASPGGYSANEYFGHVYSLANDTVINSLHYTNLGYNETWYYNTNYTPTSHSFSAQNLLFTFPGQIIGAIREDTSKKVWFRNFNPNLPADSEILLYNFKLHVGDTVVWYSHTLYRIVDFIDSVSFPDGTTRARFHFQDGSPPYVNQDFWIEGMGSSLGLFGNYNYCFHAGDYQKSWLNCFWGNGQYLFNQYLDLHSNCDEETYGNIDPSNPGNTTPTDSELFVSTLVRDKLFINQNNDWHCVFEIKNIYGEELFSEYHELKNMQIDLSPFPSGLYFLEITHGTERIALRKFVKE